MTHHQSVYIWLKVFHLASIFILLIRHNSNFWEMIPWTFWYFWQISLWFWHHTFQYIFSPPFPSQTSFQMETFSALFFLLKIDICRALWKRKRKCEDIYRHKSTHASRSNKTIDQSFMTSLKIYLQQSHKFQDFSHKDICAYITS